MDSIGAWHEAETALMNEAGIALTKKERDELNALTLEEAGAFFHERFGIRENAQSVVDAILNYLLDYYRTRSEATRGALSFVEAMSEAGVDMCVLSSSPQPFLQAGLERDDQIRLAIINARRQGLPVNIQAGFFFSGLLSESCRTHKAKNECDSQNGRQTFF